MSERARRNQPRPPPPPSAAPVLSPRRKWVFRSLALIAGPALLLLVLEAVLRLVGWGYPTHFFVPIADQPRDVLMENARYGWQFFPRRLARAPDPIRLSRVKPAGTCRIFVFGESAALGDPEPAYGFSRMLREFLEARCPGTHFEIINTAMTAISSHVVARIARDCVPLQGDIWIVYMGNNEVVGPYGAASIFGAKCPPSWLISAGLALKTTRTGQAFDALSQALVTRRRSDYQEWEGMKMMLKEQIRADDPVLERVYDRFDRNLGDILSSAERAGAKVIVCSMSSNLKDCPPFAGLHRPDLSEERKAECERLEAAGAEQASRNAFTEALTTYRKAMEMDDSQAVLTFRMAECAAALGEQNEARARYTQARDQDALRFRADSRINRILQDASARHVAKGVVWLNSEALLTNACKLGIPGAECFWDHVHFNFTGNYLMARGLAEQVLSLLPAAKQIPGSGKSLTEDECAGRLAYTDWDRFLISDRMWKREQEPPFSRQVHHEEWISGLSNQVEVLRARTGPQGLAKAGDRYQAALARHPEDWVLHHRFGLLLEAAGNAAGAAEQWKRVVELVPQFVDAWFKLGEMTALSSQPGEASEYYRHVLKLRPDSFEAMNGLGLVSMAQGDLDRAAQLFAEALRVHPKFGQAHVNLGLLAARRGQSLQAEAHYREALRCDPESAAGHINLANLLAGQQRHVEAVDHYVTAIRLRPEQATVHLGLANSLEALGRSAGAIGEYQQAVRLNPALSEAQFNLGVTLAKQGNFSAATDCFRAASRLSPDDSQVHMNLGVALAKQGQFAEAAGEFKTVLRLDPSNSAARQYLQLALTRSGAKP